MTENGKCVYTKNKIILNPFHLTGPFLAPKLIILIKYLVNFLFYQVLIYFYVEQDDNYMRQLRSRPKIEKKTLKILKNWRLRFLPDKTIMAVHIHHMSTVWKCANSRIV